MNAATDAVEAGEAHVREVIVHHESGDTRAIHLEGEEHDVEHETQMVLATRGDAGGGTSERDSLHAGLPAVAVGLGLTDFFGKLDALLDLTHGGQILVEFLFVATAELGFEAAGVFEHEVEDAFVALAAAAVVEELVKSLLGEDFLRRGRGGRAPGDVGGVDRGEAAVGAVAGPLGAEHDAGHGREFAGVRGDELIHRGADLDISGGLFYLQAAKHIHLRIVAAFAFHGRGVPEASEDVHMLLESFERGERLFEDHATGRCFGTPVVWVYAIPGEAHGEPTRRGVVFDRFSSKSADGLQPRQAERCTGATEEKTT